MWELILTIGLKLLGIAVDNVQEQKELKSLYLKFVEANHVRMAAVSMHDSAQSQKDELSKPPGSGPTA